MKMPLKDPSFWDVLFSPEVRAMLMAAVISALRKLYDSKEPRWVRIGLESLLCGALGYGISSGLSHFNLSSGVSVFAGCMVGFLGVDFVRSKARQIVNKKIDKV